MTRHSKTSSFGTTPRIGHDSSAYYESRLNRELAQETIKAEADQPFPDALRNRIIAASAAEMKDLPDRCLHLMVTSPPYNVRKTYDEDLSLEEYLHLLRQVFCETYRVLVHGGRACVNVANLGRKPYIPLSHYIARLMVEIGFHMRGEIIWNKGAAAGVSMAWGSWMSASNPVLRDTHEYILVFSKGSYQRKPFDGKESTISREQFMEWTKSVWQMAPESAKKVGHPAPFPVELPYRLIQLYTYKGDIVLDPFMGSGSTALAALQSDRGYVGYETNPEYIRLAERRIKQLGKKDQTIRRAKMNDVMIQVKNFRKVYGNFVAVDDISFEVTKGEIFGMLGPNGAGKTTTLESLEGIRKADGGSLRVAGVDPTREARKLRSLIGVQLQSAGMPSNLKVGESMQFFCAYHGVTPRYDLLERLGLSGKVNDEIEMLSTGLQRRLALALAVAHEPLVLFLDEPTAGLDVPSRVELHELMRELKSKGTTILLATHDMAEAEEMSDRVAILLNGKIAATGTPLEITATGAGLTKVSVRTSASCLEKAGGNFPGVEQSGKKEDYAIYFTRDIAATVSAIIAYIESQSDSLIDLRVERPSLEDRFLEITRNNGAVQ